MILVPLILLVLTSAAHNKLILHPGPTGISLCHRVCFTTCHCQTFTYVPDMLSCYRGNLTSIQGEHKLVSNLKNNIFGNNSMHNCSNGSKIVFNRNRKLVCLRESKNVTFESGNELRMRDLPKGYNKLNGSKKILKHYDLYLSFYSAKNHCIEYGGSLAQFHTGFDWNLYQQVYETKHKHDYTWINLMYDKDSQQYMWGDGEPLRDQDRWAPNEPTNGDNPYYTEYCVSATYKRQYKDLHCTNLEKFVSEFYV